MSHLSNGLSSFLNILEEDIVGEGTVGEEDMVAVEVVDNTKE